MKRRTRASRAVDSLVPDCPTRQPSLSPSTLPSPPHQYSNHVYAPIIRLIVILHLRRAFCSRCIVRHLARRSDVGGKSISGVTRAQREYAAEKRGADAQPRGKMTTKMNVMVYSGIFFIAQIGSGCLNIACADSQRRWKHHGIGSALPVHFAPTIVPQLCSYPRDWRGHHQRAMDVILCAARIPWRC